MLCVAAQPAQTCLVESLDLSSGHGACSCIQIFLCRIHTAVIMPSLLSNQQPLSSLFMLRKRYRSPKKGQTFKIRIPFIFIPFEGKQKSQSLKPQYVGVSKKIIIKEKHNLQTHINKFFNYLFLDPLEVSGGVFIFLETQPNACISPFCYVQEVIGWQPLGRGCITLSHSTQTRVLLKKKVVSSALRSKPSRQKSRPLQTHPSHCASFHLSGRKQQVGLGQITSNNWINSTGVPQLT